MKGQHKIPILLYHDIQPDNVDLSQKAIELRPYTLRLSDFERQARYLLENGYQTISLNSLANCHESKYHLPHRPIAIVFDDGWESNYTLAYPVLKKCGFTASFFVIVGKVGSKGMMTWDHIKEMADNGMEIGSHTLTHPVPTELSDEELEFELKESKRILEKKLGRKIDLLSSPTGFYNPHMAKIAKKVGYRALCISRIGLNDFSDSDLFCLKKIGIKRKLPFHVFKATVQRERSTLFRLRSQQLIREMVRKLLGRKHYEQLRALCLSRLMQ